MKIISSIGKQLNTRKCSYYTLKAHFFLDLQSHVRLSLSSEIQIREGIKTKSLPDWSFKVPTEELKQNLRSSWLIFNVQNLSRVKVVLLKP